MKLRIKGERDKYIRYTFAGLCAVCGFSIVGNVLTGSLAWYFATTQKILTTPMTYNHSFSSDSTSADPTGMTMFATSFLYWRLNVSPENIDSSQKMILSFVPAENRDALKKAMDVEAERIKQGGITNRFETREIRVVDPGVVNIRVTIYPSTTNGTITTPLKVQDKTYQLRMRYTNGTISLLDFTEIVPPATPR